MSESAKTLLFIGVAVGLIGVAFATAPRPAESTFKDDVGTAFYPSFTDPLKATTLDILEYDEDVSELKPFKVSQVNKIWSIPSHDNYPADAERQLAEAAASLIDVKKLSYVSDSKGDQSVYGVVDPKSKDLTGGATGVGKRVELDDAEGKVLAAFIIGKSDPKSPDVHFVRVPGSDRIYRAEIKTDKLSTDFSDWIEKDLLKMNVFDFKQLVINDHSVDALQHALDQRSHIVLNFDNKDSKWSVAELQKMVKKMWVDDPMTADEELNTTKLNDLKTALKDLKIIDISRKPAGVSADLRADANLADDAKAVQSLAAHGFYYAKLGGKIELFSNEGEVIAGMNDGVEYVIRFGDIAGRDKGEKSDEPAKEGEEKKDEEPSGGASRYVFVTTRFNDALIGKPELQPLPEPAGPAKPAEQADPFKTEGEAKPEEPKTDEKPAEPKKEEPKDEKTAEADAERARIEKDNKRKQDEYDGKVKAGQNRVKELNERFADWYYIISDATYHKIHLTRDEVIQKIEKKEEAKPAATPSVLP